MKPYPVLLKEARQKALMAPASMSLSSTDNRVLTLYLYDTFGADWFGEGITAKKVSEILDSETYDSVTVRINSYGGDPFEAVAILNLINAKAKPANVVIDGVAASAASLLVGIAGADVRMGEGSMLMIHRPWTIALGNDDELRKVADDLTKIGNTMREVYVARTGLSADEVQAIMEGETWLGPAEAIEKGFADGMVEKPAAPEKEADPSASITRMLMEHELSLL